MNKRLIYFFFVTGAIDIGAWLILTILWMIHIYVNDFSFLFSIGAIATLVLLALGLIFDARERWLAFTLGAILLIFFSIAWLYSLGGFLLPLGILLLINSIIKLRQYPKIHGAISGAK